MKVVMYLTLAFLSACSTCNIPLGQYQSSGGSEFNTKLSLTNKTFVLTHEVWQPGQYENRHQVQKRGTWSCAGESLYINTKSEKSKAQLTAIGTNPLGYPETTKALVFESSKNEILSKEILYPLDIAK